MKNIAVLLIGCGHQDGSEITEVVSTLISLSEFGANYRCFSIDQDFPTQNHIEMKPDGGHRNMMTEAARITRGDIHPISSLDFNDFDALVIPGGNGIAFHLSNWFESDTSPQVRKEVAQVISDFHKSSRPIGAICISPVLLATTLGAHGVNITLGGATDVEKKAQKLGAEIIDCPVEDFVSDRFNKIVTTPAYMVEATPFQVYTGIRGAIQELVEMA